ncbi:hypothetical protein KUCAC02_011630 [Chaenocephalus aceratus]|uniref:Uncharacterized protein n=1 Tax=Chaenocephalus aceratus TaxID=36190 RepID=A0ACB9WWY9_CHAAC|nr:hypothetical protein KUCAC02_011630 [Chaenocephalus aceratus]
MQSLPVEVGSSSSSSSAPRDTSGPVVQVCFPSAQGSVLGSLNQQREDGQLCDLSIHVQGHVFKAHRCVLAASSPYFHDQVLLKNMSTVSIPAVMDPLAFESVLSCAYTGELRMLRDDIVNYLTVGSVLQISSNGEGMAGGGNRAGSDGGVGDGVPQVVGSKEPQRASLPPSRPSVSESQSPSSTNYFSPRDGGGAAAAGASADRGGASNTPSYSSEQEVGVSDSFGVSSYQDGDHLLRRPAYSQPSIMPRKQWVVVKTERMEDDDLIVVSLSADLPARAEGDMNSQVDYCQSSEDYLKFEGSLMDQTLPQHLHDSAAGQSQSANRAVSALLGQVQSAASARAQLFPLDMLGNQILLYSQASGLSLDGAPPPLGMAGGMMGGASFKGPSLEHGAVHLSVQGGLGVDGVDCGGMGGGGSNSTTGGSGKVFMCHCGKTFTHKSMRDRHINMHLDLRPFHCPVCAKKFKMKHHLTEHMKTHTGLKPYDCLGCGKKFMWRDSFMRHRSHCEGGQAGSSSNGVNNMAAAGALLGVSQSQGAGMFAALGLGRSVCEEDVCEVSANDSSVT